MARSGKRRQQQQRAELSILPGLPRSFLKDDSEQNRHGKHRAALECLRLGDPRRAAWGRLELLYAGVKQSMDSTVNVPPPLVCVPSSLLRQLLEAAGECMSEYMCVCVQQISTAVD